MGHCLRLLFVATSLFLTIHAMEAVAPTSSVIRSSCACGRVKVTIQASPSSISDTDDSTTTTIVPRAIDCHCSSCRSYHQAAFASFLAVAPGAVKIETTDASEGATAKGLKEYSHSCQGETVTRIACRHCASKLLTQRHANDETSASELYWINMGPLVEESLPASFRSAWRQHRRKVGGMAPVWSDSRPSESEAHHNSTPLPTITVKGGCACGKASYSFPLVAESSEVQHCYCMLCRQLSGSAFMSWIPVEGVDWTWTSPTTPPLVRTTSHGQRHICESCGSVMTIVYDDQEDMVWPAGGGLDDATLPKNWNGYMGRAIHICCRYRQGWYALPKDGLERVQEAC